MTEAVSRSCSRVLPHHEWVSELFLGDASAWLKDGCVMLTCRVLWHGPLFHIPLPHGADSGLVNEGRMLATYSLVLDVALDSAPKFPTSKTNSARGFVLTARTLMTMTHGARWWQQEQEDLMRGWEINNLIFEMERTILWDLTPRHAHVDEQDSRQDDDEWRNWPADKPELDCFDEWDEDDGPPHTEQSLEQLRKGVAQVRPPVRSRCCSGSGCHDGTCIAVECTIDCCEGADGSRC